MHLRTKASFRCQSNGAMRSFLLTESLLRSFFLTSDADLSSEIRTKVSRLYFCSSLYRIAWFNLFVFFPLTPIMFNHVTQALYRALG